MTRAASHIGSLALACLSAGCAGAIEGEESGNGTTPSTVPVRPGDPARPGQMAAADPDGPGVPPLLPDATRPLPPGDPVATTRAARLSHRQWENAVRDLLGLAAPSGLSDRFRDDPTIGKFDNNGAALSIDETLRRDYREAAERLAEQATATPAALARLLPPNLPMDGAARARAFVASFGLRVYRRPLTEAEVARHVALMGKGPAAFAGRDPFTDSVRIAVEAFLQSPHFLYRTELQPAAAGRQLLGVYDVAAKLSFTLSNTIPDAELLAAAGSKALADRGVIRKQAERLLGGAAADSALEDFHGQLLRLHTYEAIEKDPKAFPEYASGIGGEMRKETLLFTRDVVSAGGGLRELLLAPHTFVSKRLATVYKVAGPTASGVFDRAALDPVQRAGLLTQAGFLAANAHAREVDSIHRGVFVHDSILCTALPEPAEGVSLSGAKGTTNRQRIASVTGDGTCGAGCHSHVINPVGFAFEHYDALGRWRANDNGVPVDASGTFAFDGVSRSWTDAVGFSRHAAESRVAHECYARHLMEYLHGRVPAAGDEALVRAVGQRSRDARAAVKALALELVTSDEFLTRAPQGGSTP